MLVPIDDLRDETACCELQLSVLHPKGLHCPEGHDLPAAQAPHDRHRTPVLVHRCRACGKVFNVFTGTPLHGARFSPSRPLVILRGFAEGVPRLHLAVALDIRRRHLLTVRHRVQALAFDRSSPSALPDRVVEADGMCQIAGEKGRRHPDPAAPAAAAREPVQRARHLRRPPSADPRGDRATRRATSKPPARPSSPSRGEPAARSPAEGISPARLETAECGLSMLRALRPLVDEAPGSL